MARGSLARRVRAHVGSARASLCGRLAPHPASPALTRETRRPAPRPRPPAAARAQPKMIIKPADQVPALSDKELAEDHTRVLKADNPQAPSNLSRFNHREKSFKFDPTVDQTAIALSLEGYAPWEKSGAGQRAGSRIASPALRPSPSRPSSLCSRLLLHVESDDMKKQRASEEAEKDGYLREQERKRADGIEAEADDLKGLRNQFNFSERASQTLGAGSRERSTSTEPPASVEYSALATQWEIYDAYMDEQERQKAAKDKGKAKNAGGAGDGSGEGAEGGGGESDDVVHSEAVGNAARILERMANQNACDDIAQDFKYWEDASDAFREGEGTLLPLWKFTSEKAKRKHVTCIKWNPAHADLFAVGYGSYDFMKQGSGLVCGFSLKNPSYPEFSFTTEAGVMALDWHPAHASLLCAGLYDGAVCVFDVHGGRNAPIFSSTVKSGKHTDPVWEVSWQEEDLAKSLSFFSVSSDGRVTLWTLGKSALEHSDVMSLRLVPHAGAEAAAADESALSGLAGGCCFDFNKQSAHLFVVGTEEGRIHKCSKAYNSQYLQTYEGHHMAVYALKWNRFHPHAFLSCSADWTCKVWDHRAPQPRLSYDLGSQVGDVAWTPWSSTTFAACTADGKVRAPRCRRPARGGGRARRTPGAHAPCAPCLCGVASGARVRPAREQERGHVRAEGCAQGQADQARLQPRPKDALPARGRRPWLRLLAQALAKHALERRHARAHAPHQQRGTWPPTRARA